MDRREMLGMVGAAFAIDGEHKTEAPSAGPMTGPHAHFCGIHMAKSDPKFQIVTQHYCTAHSERDHDDMFQCILFDKTGRNAKLLGVEYIVSDTVRPIAMTQFFPGVPRRRISGNWRHNSQAAVNRTKGPCAPSSWDQVWPLSA